MCVSGTCFDSDDLQCRANGTVAFQIPSVVEASEVHIEEAAKCKEYGSNGLLLVPREGSCEEFSICNQGLHKGTLKCQSGFHFNFATQGCISEDLSVC